MNVALRPEHLNILSICTGGAGLDIGVELAIQSARTVCMVEREAFSVASLVAAMEQGLLHPAPVWSDARTFNGREWRGAVDGLIGGIPCQPHSLAGRKQGSNDARDLWSTARRIIVQSGAWFVVIENVGGMLAAGSDEIAGAQRVFRDLHKLGFETEGGLFTAAEVGASHQRERIFILGVADPRRLSGAGWREPGDMAAPAGAGQADCEQWQRDGNPIGDCRGDVRGVGLADTYGERLEGLGADDRTQGRANARRSAGLRDGTVLVHAERSKRRPDALAGHGPDRDHEGWDQEAGRLGEQSELVGNAAGSIGSDISDRNGETGQRVVALDRPAGGNDYGRGPAGNISREREDAAPSRFRPLFAPGPSDLSSWSDILASSPELEPAFRRVADGMASRMDIGRVDRLRMLGNGVVPLQAAYALRTLVTRLAARGSAGAARLVRMMEIAA